MRKFLILLMLLMPFAALAQDAPTLPARGTGETMAIRAAHTDNAKAVAAATTIMAAHLKDAGYTIITDQPDAPPHYLAVFQLAFDKGMLVPRELVEQTNEPQAAPSSMGMNSMGGDNMGMMPAMPPPTTRFTTSMVYDRVYRGAFVLDIFDMTKSNVAAYHAQFTASGPCANVDTLIAPILTALFKNFPDTGGKPLTASAPAKKSC